MSAVSACAVHIFRTWALSQALLDRVLLMFCLSPHIPILISEKQPETRGASRSQSHPCVLRERGLVHRQGRPGSPSTAQARSHQASSSQRTRFDRRSQCSYRD
jgi:hypothetical protein